MPFLKRVTVRGWLGLCVEDPLKKEGIEAVATSLFLNSLSL